MKSYRKNILAILIMLCFNCKSDDKIEIINNQIPIDSNLKSTHNIFDIIDKVEVSEITLKNSNDFVLNNITKALKHKGCIFLGDDDNQIHIVDESLNIVNTLSNLGSGPNEYRNIKDWEINKFKDELYVYDFDKQRFLVYDLSFNYLRTKNVGYNFIAFKFLKENLALFTAKHQNMVNGEFYNYDLILLGEDFNVLNTHIPFDKDKFSEIRLHKKLPFFEFNENLIFNDLISDTIYSINHNKIVPLYYFKYFNKTLSSEFKNLGHKEIRNQFIDNSESFKDLDLLANVNGTNGKYIISNFSNDNENIVSFYNLVDNEVKNYKFPKENNTGDYNKIFKPFFSEDRKFTTFVYPYVLEFIKDQYVRKFKFEDTFTKKIDYILDNNVLDGNQIILQYVLK